MLCNFNTKARTSYNLLTQSWQTCGLTAGFNNLSPITRDRFFQGSEFILQKLLLPYFYTYK